MVTYLPPKTSRFHSGKARALFCPELVLRFSNLDIYILKYREVTLLNLLLNGQVRVF